MAERVVTDRFRQAVYQAEDQWSAIIDRGGVVDFFGSQLDAPIQLRFGSLSDVETYVTVTCARADVQAPAVRHRKGGARAHYSQGVIAIPSDQPWAMRESVVLHEIAHHVAASRSGSAEHDERFTSAMLFLVGEKLGPVAELLLRTGYAAAGVPVGGER